MKIIEVINRIDTIKPNTYTEREKIYWLSVLDGHIKNDIIDTHEGGENISFEGYNENTDVYTTELLAPAPYDEMYLYWLECKIDYYNGEMVRYNNSITMFNTIYEGFAQFYNREHKPSGGKRRFLF